MDTALEISSIETFAFITKLGAATLSGIFIGLEREMKGKSAGLKTNTLVAIGAAVFILISLQFQEGQNVDITRVLSQVVTGVGFLGAGAILQKKHSEKVKGLTTAATIWCSAGAGCLAAVGMYKELSILTIWVVFFNIIFGFINKKLKPWEDK